MLDVFFLFSRYLSTKNMWSLWFWIMSPNMKPYETFEKLRNKLLFGWSWHLKFSKQWTSLECPMPFCIPVHHVCFGSKINQRKTPFLGYLTSRSTHLEFLFLSVDRVTYLPSYRLVILSYAKKCRHLCCLFPMGLKMSKLAVDTQTVLKTLGFLLQVFFDFSKSLFGGQKFLVIIKPQQTRGSYARLQGGGSSQQCSRVNHIPLWAKKKKSYRGSTQDSFYSEGRYPNVQIWLRDTLRFSVWRKFGGASFVLCYLSSSQLTSFATFSPVKMDDSKNLWRVNPCETRSFFFQKKDMNEISNLQVDSLNQPSKLLHWSNLQSCWFNSNQPPKTYIYQNRKGEFWPCKIWEGPIPPVPSGDLFTGRPPCLWRWRSAKCSGPSYRNVTRSWQRWRRPRRPWRCLGSATKTQGKSAEFIESKPTTIFLGRMYCISFF